MKFKMQHIGIAGLVIGFIIKVMTYFGYLFQIAPLGMILILAGAALIIFDIFKAGKKPDMIIIAGLGVTALAVIVDIMSRLMYFGSYTIVLFIYVAGIALTVFAGAKSFISIDKRSFGNIKNNGNKLQATQNVFVILTGLILVFYGLNEVLTLFVIGGIAVMIYGALQLVKSLTQPDIREDALFEEKDTELSAEIKKLQNMLKLANLCGSITSVILLLCVIMLATTSNFMPLVVVAIISLVVSALKEGCMRKIKKFVANNIVKQALEEVFEVEEYKPFGSIAGNKITGKDFGIGSFDHSGGSDYVRGFYNGLPIEMCDMHLTSRETRTDENGHTEEYDSTVFRGFWLICDFEKELSAELRLWERGKLGKLVGGEGIKTENEKFNKTFRIESEVEVEAFYILTPHMMEYILGMDKKANGETHMRFDRDGKMHIAINSGRDAFEVGKKFKNATLLRKQFVDEIRYVTDIIDELRLVDTLYKEQTENKKN